jgi:hypothetical protein
MTWMMIGGTAHAVEAGARIARAGLLALLFQ